MFRATYLREREREGEREGDVGKILELYFGQANVRVKFQISAVSHVMVTNVKYGNIQMTIGGLALLANKVGRKIILRSVLGRRLGEEGEFSMLFACDD